MQSSSSSGILFFMNTARCIRRRLIAAGQVQGVGFRPFIYRLAGQHQLTGQVRNTSEGVCIEVQGTPEAVEDFCRALPEQLPPLARLTSLKLWDSPVQAGETSFCIVASQGHGSHHVLVSPDTAPCPACLADMADPANRRYRYPFTNCTDCGPRFTITRTIPYDRATTSMSCFPLCPECRAEYEDPANRRFHAQPNACPVCGPRIRLVMAGDASTQLFAAAGGDPADDQQAIRTACSLLHAGKILAVKGLGGFHLVCDARNEKAIASLRLRKGRPHKALAVMLPDLECARQVLVLCPEEEALLTSSERPIVVCRRRPGVLPDLLAPDSATLGVMLPYTPFHVVLFALYREHFPNGTLPALVMTSGNAGGEPICLGNREALTRLSTLADAFLLHNRDILVRADDSVVRMALPLDPASPAEPLTIWYRRARGQVPRPVPLSHEGPCVLGTGPELKATLCLTRQQEAFVGQHIGDLENPAVFEFYEEAAAHLERLLAVQPEQLVCDLHPDFLSTRFAKALSVARNIPLRQLQHHFAHAWSVLAEHAYEGPALVLALDGTGLGEDGSIWGGELLWVNTMTAEQRRLGRLSPFVLPGGEAAIREPWRIAQAMLLRSGEELSPCPWAAEPGNEAVTEMVRRGVRCLETSSCGRLFDAIAALLGLCLRTSYEGQAAVRLEAACASWPEEVAYPVILQERGALLELDSLALFRCVLEDLRQGRETGQIAARFHATLAEGMADMAARVAQRMGLSCIGISGGVMQNVRLAVLLPQALRRRKLTVLLHKVLPPNDGCVSLGQACWGRALARNAVPGKGVAAGGEVPGKQSRGSSL